ncbi:hypothetical protein [Occallatibacter riparius]|uniref:Uncharacterized protein n=1 Tax=Occallatibacter riparius TaxID=1002689 RepID=A0A9J7BSA6_9BACT|nr:hypothetical protein [Occallatibacter riparius]UWZ83925.1 hypothetical protein MOP44_25625 [Occallatibacter riparius]
MKRKVIALLAAMAVTPAFGQLTAPKTVQAGSAFSIESGGSGQATLYIVGIGQVIKRDAQLGGAISIPEGTLYNAGRYVAFVSSAPNDVVSFDVTPAKVADVNFLARPSRLPVGLHNGITGAVYVFDSYKNLVTSPTPISFSLTTPSGASENRTAQSKNGAAWIAMDSSPKEGAAHFIAKAGDVSSTRIIGQVPGDPCTLRMSAKPSGQKIALETDPVHDCSGNAVPDGTIVTFTETYNGAQSIVDVPLKRGVAKVEMPAYPGANISVASGVVLGNQIHWGK